MRFQIKKFQLFSDFKTKFLQRVRFQIKFSTTRQILKQIFTTCLILNQKFYNVSDFVSKKLFKNQILHKNVHSKNHVSTEFTP